MRVPHSRGDEPQSGWHHGDLTAAFPTAVGMNRIEYEENEAARSVPHSRGDEPKLTIPSNIVAERSPQPWG